MKALVIHRPEAASFDIYLYSLTSGGGRIAYHTAGDGQRMITAVEEGKEMPRFLRLSDSEMEAVGRALIDALPPDASLAAALSDARATRDRMIDMVEGVVASTFRPREA